MISLIFHFQVHELFDIRNDKKREKRKEQFFSFVSRLIKRNVPFICIFHDYYCKKDFIEDFIKENKIDRLDVDNSWSKSFRLLSKTRLKQVQQFWFIDTKICKEDKPSFNGSFPMLRFSWFFTTKKSKIGCYDKHGLTNSKESDENFLCEFKIIHKKSTFMSLSIKLSCFKKYSRILDHIDVGKRIAQIEPVSYKPTSKFFGTSEYDSDYLLPREFVLEHIFIPSGVHHMKVKKFLHTPFLK